MSESLSKDQKPAVSDEQARLKANELIASGKTIEEAELPEDMALAVRNVLETTLGNKAESSKEPQADPEGTKQPADKGQSGDGVSETITEDPRLTVYGQQYESLSADIKERMTWEAVATKLLANNGEKLKKAEAMQGGGHLFDINTNGEVLIRDKGLEPVMYGFDDKKKLIQIYDRNPEDMEKVQKWANYCDVRKQVLDDGYEMFKDDGEYGFGDDMKHASVVNEDGLFVASADKDEWRRSWLESGENPALARYASFNPGGGVVYVNGSNADYRNAFYGVVRLLRV